MSFSPSSAASSRVLLYVGVAYAALTIVTLVWLGVRGEFAKRMTPSFGDLSIAGLLALTLHLACIVTVAFLAGTAQQGWVARIYLQIGDPVATITFNVAGMVIVIAACEEIVWRGLVNAKLIEAFGPMRGLVAGTILYAAAHASTMYLLRDPFAGFNPLVFVAAAGCGFVWGLVALKTERLAPSVFAHALFSWSVVQFPLWRFA
jgi:membrane protease YdiL (CAAX protease family)